ncbi:MAG: YraN family protein [Bacteroidaceae bacterium]|nr:YraN family protein [Bacteroidaceae bacterium]
MARHNEVGRRGEDLAAEYLETKGYSILDRNWKSGHKDIDIIARTAQEVVFVEVKTRSSVDFGDPWEAVNHGKLRHLKSAINHYLHYRDIDLPVRFDIISVVGADSSHPEIEHIEDIEIV